MTDGKGKSAGINAFKFLYIVLLANVVFQVITDVTSSRLIDVWGAAVSVTIFYFPFTYIISDVTTEVYGYQRARTVLWFTMAASVFAGVLYQLILLFEPSMAQPDISGFQQVFGQVPRILIGGWLAVFLGDITNNFIMSRMKLAMRGKMLWLRTITSTIGGQIVNTGVFYSIGLFGVLPTDVLVQAILVGATCKILVEIVMTPVTYAVVSWLKKKEGVDTFDENINYNPFIFRSN